MPLEPCCLKEQFCVLRMKDLEQKDGEVQWSSVRHMLSIKKPAINTRYTAPEQHDSSPGGGGGPEEGGRQERIERGWEKEKWGSKGKRKQQRLEGTGAGYRKSHREWKRESIEDVEKWQQEVPGTRCWQKDLMLSLLCPIYCFLVSSFLSRRFLQCLLAPKLRTQTMIQLVEMLNMTGTVCHVELW